MAVVTLSDIDVQFLLPDQADASDLAGLEVVTPAELPGCNACGRIECYIQRHGPEQARQSIYFMANYRIVIACQRRILADPHTHAPVGCEAVLANEPGYAAYRALPKVDVPRPIYGPDGHPKKAVSKNELARRTAAIRATLMEAPTPLTMTELCRAAGLGGPSRGIKVVDELITAGRAFCHLRDHATMVYWDREFDTGFRGAAIPERCLVAYREWADLYRKLGSLAEVAKTVGRSKAAVRHGLLVQGVLVHQGMAATT